jgi:DDE superfamily endonuclease
MGSVAVRNVYVDYLLSSNGSISATSLSEVLDNEYSHDQISRMLYKGEIQDKDLYKQGKRLIKALAPQGKKVLIFDDSIQHKPYSEVNGLIAYHYDHSEQRSVKGINFITALYSDEHSNIPLSMQLVKKELRWDEKKGKEVWKVNKTKNELFREMAARLTRSRQVDYVLADSWYASKENMTFIKEDCGTHFVMALKANRLASRNPKEAEKGLYKPLQELRLGKGAVKLYLKELDFPVLVVKKVFKNGDGSSGTLYLACSDLEMEYEQIFTLYKRRWRVEEYHKSLKSNCSLGKCQASSHSAQQSHFYLAAFAFLQLEKAKIAKGKNHFGLIRNINILTTKYALTEVKKQLHFTLTKLEKAA